MKNLLADIRFVLEFIGIIIAIGIGFGLAFSIAIIIIRTALKFI